MSGQNITKRISGDGSVTVTLNGALGIETSAELHRVLTSSLFDSQRVVLGMQQLEGMDATTLQVICSACRSAVSQNSSLVSESAMPACLVSFCRDMGISQGATCNQNSNDPCFWNVGG